MLEKLFFFAFSCLASVSGINVFQGQTSPSGNAVTVGASNGSGTRINVSGERKAADVVETSENEDRVQQNDRIVLRNDATQGNDL